MTHVMVDLETWGTDPGCEIRSIGAVCFDPDRGTYGEEFYVNVDGAHPDLKREARTEAWWADQSAETQALLSVEPHPLPLALSDFSAFWLRNDGTHFWCHGPSFDEPILRTCYQAVNMEEPWHYRAPRDTRTIFDLVGEFVLPFNGVPHYALDDAKHQAACVIHAYRRLVPLYSFEVGRAGYSYLDSIKPGASSALPAKFRWRELFHCMLEASRS